MTFRLAMIACAYQDCATSTQALRDFAPVAVFFNGDVPGYYALNWATHQAVAGVTYLSTPAEFAAHADSVMRLNEMQRLLDMRAQGRLRLYWHPDDHGWGGDNWDHSIGRAQQNNPIGGSANAGVGPPTAAEVLTHWRNGNAGHALTRAAYFDDPPFGAAGNGDIPSQHSGTPGVTAADFPIRYHFLDYDGAGMLGGNLVRVIKLDCTSYKSSLQDVDNAAKTMLGLTQRAWLLAAITDAQTRGFAQVVVVSTKDLFNIDNTDGWFRYSTERDLILAAIHTANAPVVWLTGDRHTPHVGKATVAAGDAYDCLCLCPTSFSTCLDPLTPYKQNVWTTVDPGAHVFGGVVVDTDTNSVVYSIRDAFDGSPMYSAVVPFGARLPTLETMSTPRRFT